MFVASALTQTVQRASYLASRSFAKASIAQIKELRNLTGSSIDDCKKALEAENGDMDLAREYLKKRGMAIANKKSGRDASEGVIAVKFAKGQETAVIAEINCETDFVAKNEIFLRYVDILMSNLTQQPNLSQLNFRTYESGVEEEINKLLSKPLTNKVNLEGHECGDLFEAKQLTISKLQENIKVRRIFSFGQSTASTVAGSYLHMTLAEGIAKSACLVELESAAQNKQVLKDLANNLAMQVLGSRPEYLRREDVPQDVLAQHIERVKEAMQNAIKNKPQNVVEKMVEGKLKKQLEESVLYFQEYIVSNDSGKTVEEFLKEQEKALGSPIKINGFQIVEVGTQ